jgi:hypothetical protein
MWYSEVDSRYVFRPSFIHIHLEQIDSVEFKSKWDVVNLGFCLDSEYLLCLSIGAGEASFSLLLVAVNNANDMKQL